MINMMLALCLKILVFYWMTVSGKSALQVSKKFNIPSRTLYDKVKKMGITTGRQQQRKQMNNTSSSFNYSAAFPSLNMMAGGPLGHPLGPGSDNIAIPDNPYKTIMERMKENREDDSRWDQECLLESWWQVCNNVIFAGTPSVRMMWRPLWPTQQPSGRTWDPCHSPSCLLTCSTWWRGSRPRTRRGRWRRPTTTGRTVPWTWAARGETTTRGCLRAGRKMMSYFRAVFTNIFCLVFLTVPVQGPQIWPPLPPTAKHRPQREASMEAETQGRLRMEGSSILTSEPGSWPTSGGSETTEPAWPAPSTSTPRPGPHRTVCRPGNGSCLTRATIHVTTNPPQPQGN